MNFKFVIELLATCGLFRKIKKAPGTVGTLWGIPLAILFYQAGEIPYMGLTLLFTIFSIWVCHLFEMMTGEHDLKHVTIDEVAGYLIAMTWLPLTWQSLLGAFVLFRIFDILKPFPISYLDRKIEGGLGTVVDDVAAGIAANIILQIIFTNTAWLGYRYTQF